MSRFSSYFSGYFWSFYLEVYLSIARLLIASIDKIRACEPRERDFPSPNGVTAEIGTTWKHFESVQGSSHARLVFHLARLWSLTVRDTFSRIPRCRFSILWTFSYEGNASLRRASDRYSCTKGSNRQAFMPSPSREAYPHHPPRLCSYAMHLRHDSSQFRNTVKIKRTNILSNPHSSSTWYNFVLKIMTWQLYLANRFVFSSEQYLGEFAFSARLRPSPYSSCIWKTRDHIEVKQNAL